MLRKSVQTSDGVTLSYLEGGTGDPIVMLPGWSQTASMYQGQFQSLCQVGRVVAIDHRGHGESEKPQHGYKVQRLAKDLFEVLEQLNISNPSIIAHSMGAAVTWSFLSLFGAERPPRSLVFVDEPRALLARPDWSEQDCREAGAIVPSLEGLAAFTQAIKSADTPETAVELLRPMFTSSVSEETLRAVALENLKLPRAHAAELLADNVIQDWKSVIERIDVPTLVFGGKASVHPVESQEWIASTIPRAELELFEAEEGGNHFLFYENPDRFNQKTVKFLKES